MKMSLDIVSDGKHTGLAQSVIKVMVSASRVGDVTYFRDH